MSLFSQLNRRFLPTFASSQESDFCHAWRTRRFFLLGNVLLYGSLPINLAVAIFAPYFAHESTINTQVYSHSLTFVGLLLAFAIRRNKLIFTYLMAALAFFITGVQVTMLHFVTVHAAETRHLLYISSYIFIFAAVTIQLSPIGGATLGVGALGIALAGCVAIAGADGAVLWSMFFATHLGFLWFMRVYRDYREVMEARREFRFRSAIMPAYMVGKSLDSADDLSLVFESELKECVCLCSDWRNYQSSIGTLPAKEVARILGEYYNLCDMVLEEMFPQRNYYADWIADELFVVFFAVEGMSHEEVKAKAVEFGVRLLKAKQLFVKSNGIPEAVDVGISSGQAVLGIMGPDGFRKATALGVVPGEARRLQQAAKLLRHKCDERDRLILDKNCIEAAKAIGPIKSYDNGVVIRDLDDTILHYWEAPMAKRKKQAAA